MVGLGPRGPPRPAHARAARRCSTRALELDGTVRAPVGLGDVALRRDDAGRRARASASRTSSASGVGAQRHRRRGSSTAPARATSTWSACAPARRRARPTPSSSRPATRRCWRCSAVVRRAERVAVVPFGGGTSIVGGLAPLRGAQHAVISLDLGRLRRLLAVDARSLTVSVAAGTRAPALEAALAEHDLTLGHYPDSFEFASIGGCAATRSVGQASSGYGRIDQAIQGVRLATPRGELVAPRRCRRAPPGPALRELIVGSEGVLGVITGLLLRVRTRPPATATRASSSTTSTTAVEALRVAVQDRATPDVVRLSDELQTNLVLAGGEADGRRAPLGRQLPAQPPRRARDRRLGGPARRGRRAGGCTR